MITKVLPMKDLMGPQKKVILGICSDTAAMSLKKPSFFYTLWLKVASLVCKSDPAEYRNCRKCYVKVVEFAVNMSWM
jgi:hypothetical protein